MQETEMKPYAVPKILTPGLTRARAYWEGLLRGGAEIPFWDDLVLPDLGDLARNTFLIDVFDLPQRFRMNTLGEDLGRRCGQDLLNRFLDDVALDTPFEFLLSQCSATVEAASPTWYGRDFGADGYARLIAPMWGEGRIGMLLGVVEWS
jgi:hypothetical protein